MNTSYLPERSRWIPPKLPKDFAPDRSVALGLTEKSYEARTYTSNPT